MSYEPLHHKYRPQTFGDLVGQTAIAATLTNAIRQQRIAPAYLFTGPRGTGKTSSARILAKSLNCLESDTPTEQPCGTCEACHSIARGVALDVIEIDAASNTGVDNIRELIERAQFAPVQCRYKVYAIDEVHMLSNAAFNALLKTLEEPPERVVFVLATTDPQRVLPTIISRCQRFDFRRIPLDAMTHHLGAIAAQENIAITNEAVQLVAQMAQGGLRDAESLLDQLSLLDGEIDPEQVWELVGAVPERDLLVLLKAISRDDGEAVLDRARHLMDRGREPLIVLQNLAGFYRDLLIAKTARDRNDLVAITPGTWEELCDLAQTLEIPTILAGQQHLRACEVQIKNTTQPRLWLEVILMGLLPSALNLQAAPALAAPAVQTAPVKAQPAATPSSPSPTSPSSSSPPNPESQVLGNAQPTKEHSSLTPTQNSKLKTQNSPSSPSPLPSPSSPSPATPVAANLNQTWQQLLGILQPHGTRELLRQQGFLLEVRGKRVRVGIRSAPLLKMAQSRVQHIETAFRELMGKDVKVSLEVAEASDAPAPASQPPPPPRPTAFDNNGSYQAAAQPAPAQPPPAAAPPAKVSPAQSSSARPAPAPTPVAPSAVPSQPAAPGKRPEWELDEVSIAARRLADFFNGEVVQPSGMLPLTDEEQEAAPSTSGKAAEATSSPGDLSDAPPLENDDTVPF